MWPLNTQTDQSKNELKLTNKIQYTELSICLLYYEIPFFNPLQQYFTSMSDIKSSVIEFKGCLGANDANLTESSNRMTTTCQNGLAEFFIV